MSFQKIVDAAIAFATARDRALKADRRHQTAIKAFNSFNLKPFAEALDKARAKAGTETFTFERAVIDHHEARCRSDHLESEIHIAENAHARAVEALEAAKVALDKLRF